MRLLLVVAAFTLGMVSAGAGLTQTVDKSETPQIPAQQSDLDSMPRWSEFPTLPTDVPTAADIRTRVQEQQGKREQLAAELAALQWDKQEPEVITAEALNGINQARTTPADEIMSPAQLELFAASVRAAAVPPPVAD